MFSKLADDTKNGGIMDSKDGYLRLQQKILINCANGLLNGRWSLIEIKVRCCIFGNVAVQVMPWVNGRDQGNYVEQRIVQVHGS